MVSKRVLLISGILVVILVGGFLAYRVIGQNQASQQAVLRTATVTRGSIKSALNASGTARSGESEIISWHTSGKVGEVTLKAGDYVKANQELAALDPSTMSTSMTSARQTLVDAKKALDDLLNSKTSKAKALKALEEAQITLDNVKRTAAEESSKAQLALAEAQEVYDNAKKARTAMDYPHSTDPLVVENALTKYLLAKQEYKEASKEFEKVKNKRLISKERALALERLLTAKQKVATTLATYNWYILKPSEQEIAQADAELAVAKANLDKAQADWDIKKGGASSAAVLMAEATLADAQRAYDRVKDGPSADDIAAAEATVAAAQAAVDQAHLVAPFDGILTEVNVRSGDQVSSGTSAFRIDDLSSVFVDVQISEVDIQSLKVGQQATLTFDALSSKEYSGEVSEISVIATSSQGVVNYPVTVRITDADDALRPGMTAAVSIIIDQHDNVLLVPTKAVRTVSGQRSVTVMYEGQQISLPVIVGLSDGTNSEVTSEQLREGDTVVLYGTTTTTTSNSNNQNRGSPGGMGGPGGGMFPP